MCKLAAVLHSSALLRVWGKQPTFLEWVASARARGADLVLLKFGLSMLW